MDQPIIYRSTGEGFEPSTNYQSHLHGQQYPEGTVIALVPFYSQSDKSRNHEFAWLTEAWLTLPDALYAQYPNSEVLRKHGLIAKGYCTMVQHVCPTAAEAHRLQAILKPYDQYAIVVARGNVVTVYTAVSQSKKAMGAKQFQQSKTALFEFVGDLLGVDPETIGRQADAA